LNQPIGIIGSTTKTALNYIKKGNLEKAKTSLEKLSAAVEDLGNRISVYKALTQRSSAEETVRVSDLVNEVERVLQHQAEKANVKIDIEIFDQNKWNQVLYLKGDPFLYRIAIRALVHNAIQACSDPSLPEERRHVIIRGIYTPRISVDDEKSIADSLKDLAESEGYDVEVYHTLKDVRAGLQDVEKPMVIILDHDFSEVGERDQVGYDLCQWLRENHPFGLLLPIIYLTGRETEERYLQQQRNAPFVHPNAFVSKDQLASNQDLLSDLLHRYEKEFERILELFDKQSAQQALIGFEEMEPELEKYEVD